jgi:aspartyl protease family protein
MSRRPIRQRSSRNAGFLRTALPFPFNRLNLRRIGADFLRLHPIRSNLLHLGMLQLRLAGTSSFWRQPWLLMLILCLLVLAPLPGMVNVSGHQGSAHASGNSGLSNRLDQAVRQQNWAEAIKIIDQMIVAEPQRATKLRAYRQQLLQLQRLGYRAPNPPNPSVTPSIPPAGNADNLVAQVPILRRSGGVPVIKVTFNRTQTFDMLVDSGASITVITRPMARALGITSADVVREVKFATANGTVVKPIVRMNAVEFGGVADTNVEVAVAAPGMEMGLLGQDFLGRYDVSIRRDVIEFYRRR